MRFHEIHGSNVQFEESRTVARRTGTSFCDAFVFSETPLKLNSYLSIRFSTTNGGPPDWVGSAFIGLTTQNPSMFCDAAYSKYLIRLLTDCDDVWIRAIDEQWSQASLIVHLTFDGSLEVTSDHESCRKFVLFENLPVNVPLWFVVELYGRTIQVELPVYTTTNSREVVSLCTDANAVFRSGQKGIVPYNRSRIVIIGPANSGKNRLKAKLVHSEVLSKKNHDTMLSVESQGSGQWTETNSALIPKQKMPEINISQEYRHIAQNIVREFLLNQREQQAASSNEKETSLDLIKNAFKLSRILPKSRSVYSKEVKQQLSDNPIPEELVKIIEEVLESEIKLFNSDNESSSTTQVQIQRKNLINLLDFRGNLMYLLINQFFFSSYAVYVFAFNLADNLREPYKPEESHLSELYDNPLTLLDVLHQTLSLIHTSIASFASPLDLNLNADSENSNTSNILKPQIMLVGTHRNSLPEDTNPDSIFEEILTDLEKAPYFQHVRKQCIAVELDSDSEDSNEELDILRKRLDYLVEEENGEGYKIPLAWVQLKTILDKLNQRGIFFVDINQLHEVVSSQVELFQSYDNLNAALNFLHNQSSIFYLDCVGHPTVENDRAVSAYELGIIILDPQWFLSCIYMLCDHLAQLSSDDDYAQFGVINESVINAAWSTCIDQKFILLGCLENLDIICELSPFIQLEDGPDGSGTTAPQAKMYFFPWISKWDETGQPTSSATPDLSNISNATAAGSIASGVSGEMPSNANFFENDLNFQFYINFSLLPLSLFTRFMVRICKWSWNQGWGRKPEMCQGKCRIAVDFDHDMILKIYLQHSRVSVTIVKIFEELHNDHLENYFVGPAANVCVKVHHLVESELEALKNGYYRRLSFKLTVRCSCDAQCEEHKLEACTDEACLHFLPLQECLQKKVVECQNNRQIRTTFVQRFLPFAPSLVTTRTMPFDERQMKEDVLFEALYNQNSGDVWENIFQVEPLWMREAAKLLNSNQFTNDWIALAKRLSYTERDVSKFADEISPALALLKNWYESNGRTRYCIDVLISCLRMLSREDIASLIEYELEPESSCPPIFISYQRDSQKQVLEIRRKLEMSGFSCWMDTSSLSSGDALYGKIYEGISRAKVFICCLTPRYVASAMCNREVTLADVLHKPILPLIIEFTPWPLPGSMALILSSIVYVDLCGVGSHSGIGRVQDTETRFREILDRVTRYISGYHDVPMVPARYLQLPELFNRHSGHMSSISDIQRRTLSGSHLMRRHQRPSGNVVSDYRSVRSDTNPTANSPSIDSEQEDARQTISLSSAGYDVNRSNTNGQVNSPTDFGTRSVPTMPGTSSPGNISSNQVTFSSQIVADDELSVVSRAPIANRITNCTVCLLM